MGCMPKHFSSSSYDKPKTVYVETTKYVAVPTKLPNPDPTNYKIIKSELVGKYLVVKVNYPDCTNYEGDKILLFENTALMDLMFQGSVDPHFSDNKKYHSPIARFEPTRSGWDMAVLCAKMSTPNKGLG